MASDGNGSVTFGRMQSVSIFSGMLGLTAQSITIPPSAAHVFFSCPDSFACKVDGTAVYPAGALAIGGSELNPTVLSIAGATTISVISNVNVEISISFYA